MSKFIGNETHTFDIDKIVLIWWEFYVDENTTRVVNIIFPGGLEVYLHYDSDEDFDLIKQLRKYFKQSPLSQKV